MGKVDDVNEVRAAWKVDFTEPPTAERNWTVNKNATVIADTLERAGEVVHEYHPTCTLIAIHRLGTMREVLIDNA